MRRIAKDETTLSRHAPDSRASGERRKLYRGRQIQWFPNSVITDGKGNIISRPLTKKLPCFGDPVEWLMGRGDKMRVWGEQDPEPKGCAGCPVAAFCATIVWERLQSVPEIVDAHDRWEAASYNLDYVERYKTPAWEVLVNEINGHEWLDPNDDQLEQEREHRQDAKRKKLRKRSGAGKSKTVRLKTVTDTVRDAIQTYRDERVNEMLSQKTEPDSPLKIRNRQPDRLILMGDAWQAREILEREGKASSGRAVFERLQAENNIPTDSPKSMIKRVEEALRRVGELCDEGAWPYFNPLNKTRPRSMGFGLNPNCVFVVLDDEH